MHGHAVPGIAIPSYVLRHLLKMECSQNRDLAC